MPGIRAEFVVDQIEVHPDGLVVDGQKVQGITIAKSDCQYGAPDDEVAVTLTVNVRAKTVAIDASYLGNKPEEPYREKIDF